jgi:hypothetical protein
MSNVNKWMSWEGGVDLVALTDASLSMPNVIIHLGRMVHTPIGSAPSGMILWQPDVQAAPLVFGFVGEDERVGQYFGPHIFAGTPFEAAPVLHAKIEVHTRQDGVFASCAVGDYLFEVEMSELSAPYLINRAPAAMPPFHQQGVEMSSGKTTLKVNGQIIDIIIPPVGITGGPASVAAPNGVYAR